MDVAALGVMIPIVAIVLGLATAMVAIVTAHRQRMQRAELRHRERLAAIEKGIEIPPDPVEVEPVREKQPRTLLVGLVLVFMGIALTLALAQSGTDVPYLYGAIPAAIGLGYLLYYFIEGRHRETRAAPSTSATPLDPPAAG